MNVELTADQRAFVRKAIESGRFSREEEAVEEALALWEERERRRLEIIALVEDVPRLDALKHRTVSRDDTTTKPSEES